MSAAEALNEIVLSEGSFAGSCGARSAVFFVLGIAITLLYGAVSGYKAFFGEARKATKAGGEVKTIPLGRVETIAVSCVLIAVFLFAGAVFALSRSQIILVATDTTIVEHGCNMGRNFVETFDRKKAKFVYVAKRGKSDYDWLEVMQSGKRTARIALSDPLKYPDIITIAPEAMRAYAITLASEGKPIPASLKNLATN